MDCGYDWILLVDHKVIVEIKADKHAFAYP